MTIVRLVGDAQFTPTQSSVGQFLRVRVTYTDLQGNPNEVISAVTTSVVGNLITTNGGAQIINGLTAPPNNATEGDDLISTGGGGDFITSLGGNDTIDGGAAQDIIDAGAGDDRINYTMGQGADAVTGGAGVDTLAISGLVGSDTLTVALNATTVIGGVTLNGVERVTADLLEGVNTLNYAATVGSSVTATCLRARRLVSSASAISRT